MIFSLLTSCSDNKTKVACVGDSITFGYGLENRKKESYPSFLDKKLPKKYLVKNFGHSGATALKESDLPYWSVPEFEEVKNFQPDIIVLLLGTNDAKDYNWPGKDVFKQDYEALVEAMRTLGSSPKLYVCTPPPAFIETGIISNDTLSESIIPAIKSVAKEKNLPLIDFYAAFTSSPEHFPDSIHPNKNGTEQMAAIVYKIVETTFE